MLSSGLLMIHDSSRGGQDNVTKLSWRKQVVGPLLDLVDGDIEPGGDDTALVQSSSQVDDDLAGSVIVDDLKLPDVSVLHHDGEEPDDDLGAGSDEDLSLASLLRIVYTLQAISQGVHTNHPAELLLLSAIELQVIFWLYNKLKLYNRYILWYQAQDKVINICSK